MVEETARAGDDVLGLTGQDVDGQLVVEAFVGAGRATCVYRARHRVLDAPVALQCATVTSAAAIERAQQSFTEAVRLHYRLERQTLHIARVMSQGHLRAPTRTRAGEQVPFLVREWFEGGALARHLAERRARGLGGRPLGEVITALAPVARALEVAHAAGIVHLSVNPRTILLPADQPAEGKLAEFGYAGTKGPPLRPPLPAYAAPEQLAVVDGGAGAELLTPAADVYALALLVLELVRDLPVHAIEATRDDVAQAASQAARRAADPGLPRAAREVLIRALAGDPSRRPADARSFWSELVLAAGPPALPRIKGSGLTARADDWDPDAVTAPKLLVPAAPAPSAASEPTLRTSPPSHFPLDLPPKTIVDLPATPSFDALAASQNKADGASVEIDMSSAPSLRTPSRSARTNILSREPTVRILRGNTARELLVAVASFAVVSVIGFAAVFFFGDSLHASPSPRPSPSASATPPSRSTTP